MSYQIFPLGDSALTVDFGNVISVEINQKVQALAEYCALKSFPGFVEAVPAFSSLTVYYRACKVKKSFSVDKSAFEIVGDWLENAIENVAGKDFQNEIAVKIPVCYDGYEFAPDLEFVAETNNLTEKEVVEIHSSRIYRVFMIGFLPGFPYLGEVDERIAAQRKSTPRARVRQGSVGIAGRQTGVYPLESPGGWQIIGRTPLKLFNPTEKDAVTLLKPGDAVEFYPIERDVFELFSKN